MANSLVILKVITRIWRKTRKSGIIKKRQVMLLLIDRNLQVKICELGGKSIF